ncbi:hypothetical protein V6C32_10780 [Desulforamulus ruminis]|uniref:hypothetical protein n=1 Tax=Desulforamulus ruminis TaxID=1564 RepID=UPI002FD87F4D
MKNFKTIILMTMVFLCSSIGIAYAVPGLDSNMYAPDLTDAAKTGGAVVAAFNYVIGFVGLVILGYAVIPLITDHGLNLIRGKASFKDPSVRSGLLGFMGGAVIVLLGVTGKWFDLMMFIWSIADQILSKLKVS